MKAVVVGGGFAGLSAAYRLQKAGWEVVVLESAPYVGGRVHSFTKNGYAIEMGATQMSTGYKEYMALAREMGMEAELIKCSQVMGILHKGKLNEIDAEKPWTAAFSGVLSLRSKLKMINTVRDFLALKPKMNVLDVSASHEADTESVREYCDRRLNREIYDAVIDPMIRGYTLNSAAKVSAVEWFSSLGNLAGQTFVALRGGNQRMPEAVASHLNVRTNASVSDISRTNSGVEITYTEAGKQASIKADACVLATRLPEAVKLAPSIAHTAAPLASQLHYNRGLLVHLGYAKKTKTKALGVLLSTAEDPHIGLIWLEHNKDPEVAPPGHSQITCYFDESGIDGVGAGEDTDYMTYATNMIERIFPELRGSQDLLEISRWPIAIPNPAPGIYKAVHAMKQRIDVADPIQLAGDYFTCTGQNSAIYWGRRAAENLISGAAAQGSAL